MTALKQGSMRQDLLLVALTGSIHGSHWRTMNTQALLLGSILGCDLSVNHFIYIKERYAVLYASFSPC